MPTHCVYVLLLTTTDAMGKGKIKKHSAAELAAKDAKNKNIGGGKAGEASRRPKADKVCKICKINAPKYVLYWCDPNPTDPSPSLPSFPHDWIDPLIPDHPLI